MSEHLSAEEIERFHQNGLSPPELLRVDDHSASCESCRSLLAQSRPLAAVVQSLRADLGVAAKREPDHLNYEQLAAHVDDMLDTVDREVAESHTAVCATCAAAIDELRSFKALMGSRPAREYTPKPDPGGWQRLRSFWSLPAGGRLGLGAAVAIVTALLLFFTLVQPLSPELFRQQRLVRELGPTAKRSVSQVSPAPPHPSGTPLQLAGADLRGQVARHEQEARQARLESERLRHENKGLRQALARHIQRRPPLRRDHSESVARLLLNDGDQQWLKDERGQIKRMQAPPQSVQIALNQGIQLPADLVLLQRRDGATRGGITDRRSVSVRGPAGVVTQEDQPLFTWEPFPEATGYQVVVTDFNSAGTAVMDGGTSSGAVTEWRPLAPLPRGRIYEWQVRALGKGGIIARSEPVRIKVISQHELAAIMAAQRTGSHLTVGVLSAQAGLLVEAEQEFRALEEANPHSSFARNLRRSVRTSPSRKP